MRPADIVDQFIARLNAMDLAGAWALLAPDIVYHNIPLAPVTGPDAVRAVFARIDAEAIDWIVHASAEAGCHVLNERTDRFRLKDGRWVELRVMGIFEVVDQKITAWRDYFDLGQWMAQMAPSNAP